MKESMKKYVAEFIGTAVLVIFGCGSAVGANTLLGSEKAVGAPLAFSTLLIAFAFGLSIVAMAYSIGNVSGCHINPAVSIGMFVSGRMKGGDFAGYLIAQFLGGIAGAGLLTAFFGSNENLGQNGYGAASALGISAGVAFLVETVLTFVFVLLILGVTSKAANASVAGLIIGLTLTLIHIMGIPFTGTSVNPARSFGPALISGGRALSQVWVFLLAPAAGGIIAALVYRFLLADKKEAKEKKAA